MKYVNTKTILIALVVLLGLGLALVASLGRQGGESPVLTPSATPTADPFAQDRGTLTELSKDFGAKFFTYQRPNDPSYFESIRPYMTAEFFAENKRLTDRETVALAHSAPIRSSVDSTEVTQIDQERAEVTVGITTEESGQKREQTIVLHWLKQNDHWSVNGVEIEGTSEGGASDG